MTGADTIRSRVISPERDFAFAPKGELGDRNRDMPLREHAAGDDGGDDLVRGGVDDDVVDVARVRAIGSSKDPLVLADLEDGVISRLRDGERQPEGCNRGNEDIFHNDGVRRLLFCFDGWEIRTSGSPDG